MSRNKEVAELLYQIGEILELQGVAFKPRAYERAAQNIEAWGEDVAKVAQEGRLGEVPGVGKAIAEKVREYLDTGKLAYLEDLKKEVPGGLLAIMQLSGMGPKKAARLHSELKIKSIDELKTAADEGRIRALKGFGEKSEAEILKAIARKASMPSRFPFGQALDVAEDILRVLRETRGVERAHYAGSLRRGKDYVGDVDLLAAAPKEDAEGVMDAFVKYGRTADVIAHGATKSSIRLDHGLQVDLRVVEPEQFGAALLYFTGSKEHNVGLRGLAQKKGWTLNEYALSHVESGEVIASKTEEEIHKKLGLQFIPPELREDRGEIDLAAKKKIPTLVELGDVGADLHTHTTESDGFAGPRDMLKEAAKLGYSTYGVSDHSAGLGIARGLDGKRFREQAKTLEALRGDFPKLTILQGSEVNIKKSGDLDLTPEVRAGLDYVIGSVHSAFTLPEKEQTARVLKAIGVGIDILGHPTGRLLGERPSIEFDLEEVAQACADADVLLEIDASPFRLDLWGDMVRIAKDIGCRFVIDSDAHTVEGLHVMRYGVTQARRGMLTPGDVVSTYTPARISKFLGHAKKG